jgi:hypothetical protein
LVSSPTATPTRIILPQAGLDLPGRFYMIIGALISLAGLLIIL